MFRAYNTIDTHQTVIEALLKTFDITNDTYKQLAETYHRLANCYFNIGKYDKAAENYRKGIQQLETKYQYDKSSNKPQFNDDDFRALTELYVDLSDALMNLNQQDSAYFAFNQAINAFQCVSDKTEEEVSLLNLNDNFEAFRNYIEAITSKPSYLTSTEYQTNGRKLKTNCEVDAINAQLCGANIGENQRIDANDLCDSLNTLTMFNYAAGYNAAYLQPAMLKPKLDEEMLDDDKDTASIAKTPPMPHRF